MHKPQFLVALTVALGLVVASIEVNAASVPNPLPCMRKCSDDADYCKQYNWDHNTNQPCLSLYYVCMGFCRGRSLSGDEAVATADHATDNTVTTTDAVTDTSATPSAVNETTAG